MICPKCGYRCANLVVWQWQRACARCAVIAIQRRITGAPAR